MNMKKYQEKNTKRTLDKSVLFLSADAAFISAARVRDEFCMGLRLRIFSFGILHNKVIVFYPKICAFCHLAFSTILWYNYLCKEIRGANQSRYEICKNLLKSSGLGLTESTVRVAHLNLIKIKNKKSLKYLLTKTM